jgi:hypothetical protein
MKNLGRKLHSFNRRNCDGNILFGFQKFEEMIEESCYQDVRIHSLHRKTWQMCYRSIKEKALITFEIKLP